MGKSRNIGIQEMAVGSNIFANDQCSLSTIKICYTGSGLQ